MRHFLFILIVSGVLSAPLAAFGRDTEVILPVSGAVESDLKNHLTGVVFYMKGEKHPAVAKEFATVSADRSTRGAFRSDVASCHVAFLSSMRALQDRATQQGGDAIINVVSVTRGEHTESASNFRCVAGSVIVHVGLKGTIVKLE